MEKEISNGAMLGIVLIALAAIIGLGFGVFAIAKGTANEGVTNVQENLGAVGNSAFTDFDQKIVTGTQVMSAVQNFEGKPVAILVSTIATKDAASKGASELHAGAGVEQAYDTKGKAVPGIIAYATEANMETGGAGTYKIYGKNSTDPIAGASFINYNALLNGVMNGSNFDTSKTGKMYFDSNCFRTVEGYSTDSGKVQFNNITGNMSKSGMMEYVPSGARFQSYLIKDASNTIMGIAFEQLNTK